MTELLERGDLLAQLDAARAEGGRLLFVGGEAGVGKTALVRAFAVDRPALLQSRLHTGRGHKLLTFSAALGQMTNTNV